MPLRSAPHRYALRHTTLRCAGARGAVFSTRRHLYAPDRYALRLTSCAMLAPAGSDHVVLELLSERQRVRGRTRPNIFAAGVYTSTSRSTCQLTSRERLLHHLAAISPRIDHCHVPLSWLVPTWPTRSTYLPAVTLTPDRFQKRDASSHVDVPVLTQYSRERVGAHPFYSHWGLLHAYCGCARMFSLVGIVFLRRQDRVYSRLARA